MSEHKELEMPLNATERFLHAVAVRQEATNRRLDALVDMMSKLVEAQAGKSNTPVENVTIEEILPEESKPKRKKK